MGIAVAPITLLVATIALAIVSEPAHGLTRAPIDPDRPAAGGPPRRNARGMPAPSNIPLREVGGDTASCSSVSHRCSNGANAVANCQAAARRVPNRRAFEYTLAYLRANTGQLADPSCAGSSQGIRNTQSFLLNDIESSSPSSTNYMGYYVDFCNSQQPVRAIRMNKGTGSLGGNYADVPGRHTTVLGAFLTQGGMQPFTPYSDRSGRYAAFRQRYGQAQKLNLRGLNSSNNNTDSTKPLHESPLRSSWGCPSFGPGHRDMLRDMASRGPSLVMNYGPSSYHQSVRDCRNDGGGGNNRAAPRGPGGQDRRRIR